MSSQLPLIDANELLEAAFGIIANLGVPDADANRPDEAQAWYEKYQEWKAQNAAPVAHKLDGSSPVGVYECEYSDSITEPLVQYRYWDGKILRHWPADHNQCRQEFYRNFRRLVYAQPLPPASEVK